MLIYRLALSVVSLPALAALLWRVLAGREAWADLAERLGGGSGPERSPQAARAPRLWLHAASNGELASARPLLAAIRARRPGLAILITTNSVTGRVLARRWATEEGEIAAALAPLDHRLALARFLGRWQPAALLTFENELWPNRFAACTGRGIPVVVAGARLSARAAGRWARFAPGLARHMLSGLAWLSPQDEASGARFLALGLPPARLGPPVALKALAAAPAAPAAAPSAPSFPRADTLLAASTHPGEEEIVLNAFAAARAARPGLRLILAPRHPRRRDAIEALIAARGFPLATRSRGAEPDAGSPVYLADTLGEMPLWYAAAGMTFVGGSLVEKGGHTPHEPAALGSAILHGPHTANFAPAYAALHAAGGARAVTGQDDLARAILDLADPAAQARLASAAAAALAPAADPAALGALADRVLAALDAGISWGRPVQKFPQK